MKVRILKRKGKYWPQAKGWLFWHTIESYSAVYGRFEPRGFDTEYTAQLELNRYVEGRRKNKEEDRNWYEKKVVKKYKVDL